MSNLNEEQLAELSQLLLSGDDDLTVVVKNNFSIELDEAEVSSVAEELLEQHGIDRCVRCNTWVDSASIGGDQACEDCLADDDDEEDDDEVDEE